MRLRPLTRAVAVTGVVAVGLLTAVLPASAAQDPEIRTDEARWVLDDIGRALLYGYAQSPVSPDYAGSWSWASILVIPDLPDVMAGELCMTDNGVDPATRVCLGVDDFPALGQPTTSTVDGATVYTWAPVSDRGLSVGLTVRLKNSYVQYDWALGGADVADFDFEFRAAQVMETPELAGSGAGWRVVTDATPRDQAYFPPRPVVGHYWQGGGAEVWEFEDGHTGQVVYTFGLDAPATVTYGMFMASYDPCGAEAAEQRAITAATAGAAGFGQPFLTETDTGCIAADDVTVDVGQAVGDLELGLADELVEYAALRWNDPAVDPEDRATIADGLLNDDPDVPFRWRGEVTGLPQGITAVLAVDDQGRVVIRFTGTTTQSGTFAPVVRLWPEHLAGDVLSRVGLPVTTSFALTVTGSGSGSGGGSGSGSGSTLATTGSDGGPLALLAGGLLLAGAVALTGRRIARRGMLPRSG